MTIVTYPKLRLLYNLAQGAQWEHNSTKFWQILLQDSFREDRFLVNFEQPPFDGSSLRNDAQVEDFNENHGTLVKVLLQEAKKYKGDIATAEKQAERASELVIDHFQQAGIYSLTTTGTKFRVWYMDANHQFEPLHGTDVRGDKSQYIDADSNAANQFTEAVALIKGDIPLRQAPVLLSQSRMMDDTMDVGDSMATYQTVAGPSSLDQGGAASSYLPTYMAPQIDERTQSMAGTSTVKDNVNVEVKLTLNKSTFGRDKYSFLDAARHTIFSYKGEWEEVSGGYKLHYKGVDYFTKRFPKH